MPSPAAVGGPRPFAGQVPAGTGPVTALRPSPDGLPEVAAGSRDRGDMRAPSASHDDASERLQAAQCPR